MTVGLNIFVTNELYPFTPGGIGRMLFNILRSMSDAERLNTMVVLWSGHVDAEPFQTIFPGVRLRELDGFRPPDPDPDLAWADNPPDRWLGLSVRLMVLLQDIVASDPVAYVEFPDWSGLAFATLQERRLTGFLRGTTIAVRLHSTEALLVLHESRLIAPQDLLRYDMERACLADCDLVIGHLEPVAAITRKIFGLDPVSWRARLTIAAPPVVLNGQGWAETSVIPAEAGRIVFSSKLQEVKRPEVFVRGVARFLADTPGYAGRIVFACQFQRNLYTQAVLEAVPEAHRARLDFSDGLTAQDRDALIAGGIVVFATAFESFCLAAWEAAGLGAVVVLNRSNPAFGPGTPWKDGVNCITFDGTAPDLARALARCMALTRPLVAPRLPQSTPPWQRERPPAVGGETPGPAKVDVLIVNQGEGAALQATLASLRHTDGAVGRIVLVDDASTDAESDIILDDLPEMDAPVALRRLPAVQGYAAALTEGLAETTAPFVAILRSGTVLRKGYLARAAACLSREADVGIVCAQVRLYADSDRLEDRSGPLLPILGDGVLSGTDTNTCAEFGMVVRTDVLHEIGLRPETGYLCDWAFARAAARRGVGIVAAPREGIGRRVVVERDFGTPIDEFFRLKHIVQTHALTPMVDAPIAKLAMTVFRSPQRTEGFTMPNWYAHMLHHGYEGEVEFIAEFLGNTRLGRYIRTNARFSGFLERTINRLSRLGPR
jgi:glycosyltransferase involved in cell wall biosynthesis